MNADTKPRQGGMLPGRDIDVFGLGTTYAQFSHGYGTRNDYELAAEMFYRIRFKQWVSLKPDIQYIVQPGSSGFAGEPLRHDALVLTMRLEMSF
jgi:porin